VVFVLDRAGIVGADGATHTGAFDIAFIRCVPNLSLACPADERECRQLLSTAYAQNHPVAVRYPRGVGAGVPPLADLSELPFGKGELRRQGQGKGKGIAILAFGTLLYPALAAAEQLDATVVNMRWAKPLDLDLLRSVAEQHAAIVTVEEGVILGGAGSAAARRMKRLSKVSSAEHDDDAQRLKWSASAKSSPCLNACSAASTWVRSSTTTLPNEHSVLNA
jgi:1-deoxy-D-xylulose-5-phosphate synthase